MRWLDPLVPPTIDHEAEIAAAEASLAERPNDPPSLRRAADVLFAARHHDRARLLYRQAIEQDAETFDRWAQLAEAELWSGAPAQALVAADRGLRRGEDGELLALHGFALRQLGLEDAAVRDFERALAIGTNPHVPLKALLRPLAERGDAARLLAYCEGLEPSHRRNALALGYRAAALSQLGRVEEARMLIDLQRHVIWEALPVPEGYANSAAFNRALTEEILAQPRVATTDPDVAIDYAAQVGPALAALRGRTRERMEAYLARYAELGLDRIMPPPPAAATMRMGTTIIHGNGSNRQHVHPTGYLSSVYYVRVPESVRTANDDRGSLQLGPCDQRTHGHRACWGERLIKPVEGWIVLFPSHIFHDVVPTHTEDLRISIPMDLEPVWED